MRQQSRQRPRQRPPVKSASSKTPLLADMAYAGVNSLIKRLGIGNSGIKPAAAVASAASGIGNMASNTNAAIRDKFAAMAEGIIKSKQFVKGLGSSDGTPSEPGSWKTLAMKIGIAVLILFVLAIVIHYTITPIFKFRPGKKGMISLVPLVPDDSHEVYWKKPGDVAVLPESKTILGGVSTSISSNYSVAIDLLITDPYVSVGQNRIILFRSETQETQPSTSTAAIQEDLPRFNFAMYLDQSTNDLIVSIMTSSMTPESVTFSNVPVGKPFRIGLVIADSYLEGYYNGEIVQTRTFTGGPPLQSVGYIVPMKGPVQQLGGILNLQIWNRIVQPAEMREAYPPLAKYEDFKPAARPNSNVCLSEMAEGLITPGLNAATNAATTVADTVNSATTVGNRS